MNPYATKPQPKPSTTKPLFAAEAYGEDEQPSTAYREIGGKSSNEGAPIGARNEEIAKLRSELRTETRSLRSQLDRTRIPNELKAEMTMLRATVDQLIAERVERIHEQAVTPKQGDATASIVQGRGIEGRAAAMLTELAKGKDLAGALTRLRAAVPGMVRTSPWAASVVSRGKSLVAVIGPAGVGKTTTAAKLAARARMANKTVALISTDVFRVGAMEQLATYADLLEADFYAAATQQELRDIIARETADVIIVDTAGRSIEPRSIEAVLGTPDLRMTSGGIDRKVEILLCVPASLRAADAARIHREFAIAQPTSLTITKLDETDTPAGIVHAAHETRLPVSTFCTGHRVPEDIAPATPAAIIECLFPESFGQAE